MPVARTKWVSATVKLTCNCSFSIPVEKYYDFTPDETVYKCSTHGEHYVLRVSRLGTS